MADPLDLAALARLESLERRATPGEWWHDGACIVAGREEQTAVGNAHLAYPDGRDWATWEDLDLIVALRNAAPALLRAARAAAGATESKGDAS